MTIPSTRFEHMAIMPGREPTLCGPERPAGARTRTPDDGRTQLTPGLQNFVRRLSTPCVSRVGGVALVRIDGPLMNDPAWLYDDIECLTHGAVAQVIDQLLADASVHTLGLDMQCPGWGIDGSSDTIAALTRFARAKRLIAYVHDMAASGGVYMASLCEEVSISPTGWMGSIGTLILMYDTSKMVEKMGIRPVVIATDTDKAGGAMGVAVSDAKQANLQRVVDEHSKDFFAAVSKGRGIPTGVIADMKAGMFAARDCVSNRLADRIEAPDVFMGRMAALQPKAPASGASPSTTVPPGDPSLQPAPTQPDPSSPAPSARGTKPPTKEKRSMEYDKLTVTDLRANAGALVTEIEKAAAATALASEQERAKAPATFPQLKEAFAGDAVFITECQEKTLSLADAHKAYAATMRTRLAETQAKLTEAETKLAAAQKKGEGEEPLNGGGKIGSAVASGQDHPFMALVKQTAAEGKCTIAAAMSKAARANPQLHAAFVADSAKAMKAGVKPG